MNDEYLKIYNKIEKGEESKISIFKDKNIKVFYNGVRRVSNNINKLSPKNEWIINKILENKKSKFLIFSHFIDMGIIPLMKLLDKYVINYFKEPRDWADGCFRRMQESYCAPVVSAGTETNSTVEVLCSSAWC